MSHGSFERQPGSFDYCAEFEWPGDDEAQPNSSGSQSLPWSELRPPRATAAHNSSFLRLTVLSSTVLSRRGIALIDSFDEVSIGRDRCATPRLRLKELAVSKYHANIYWDSKTGLWSLVDMGSTHGTHVISPDSPEAQVSGSVSSQGYTPSQSTRLSPPKSASLPRTLSHLQHIVIGGTTFVVHMHADQLPCEACAVTENNLINLDAPIPKPGTATSEPGPTATKTLKGLKRDLLSRPSYAASTHGRSRPDLASETYLDRAELRRQRYPGWRDPKPPREPEASQNTRYSRIRAQDSPGSASQAPDWSAAAPISLNNVGHRLLMKKGWTPGAALGRPETGMGSPGLTEPLVPQATTNRRGLGMSDKPV